MANPTGKQLLPERGALLPPQVTSSLLSRRLHLRRDTVSVLLFLLVLAVVMAYFNWKSPYFWTTDNFLRMFKNLANMSLISLGLTYVVVVGHSDMSFHFVSCFAAMTMSYLIGEGYEPLPSVAVGVLSGLVFGWIDGIAVGKFRLPDMIVTIGIGSAAWGMAYLYSDGQYIYKNFLDSGIIDLSDGRWQGIGFLDFSGAKWQGGISYPILYMIVLYVIGYIILHRTKYGRAFYATGSNRVAARFSGIKTERYIIVAFMICVSLASFANILRTASQGNGNVKGGLVLLMPAYASVFVGYSVFRKPTVIGTFLGSFLISVMQNGFTLTGALFYEMDLIVGATLIIAIIVSRIDLGKLRSRLRAFQQPGSNQ